MSVSYLKMSQYTKDSSTSVDPDQESIESIKGTARQLAFNIVASRVKSPGPEIRRKQSSRFETLKRTADEIDEKHKPLFRGMVRRLDLTTSSDKEVAACVARVLKQMFSDGHYNWGRIVTAYAFGGSVAAYLEECGRQECIGEIPPVIGMFIAENLSTWIREHGGWDAFDQFFPERISMETSVWQGLVYTLVGLGALALSLKS